MNRDLAKSLLAELADLGVKTVAFSGGEPTQHPDFNDLIRFASERRLAVGILSNGVGLSDETLRAIHDNAHWLRLSMDGSSAAVYGRVRKSLVASRAFTDVDSTVRRFIQLDKARRRCKLAICYTIQRENADDVPEMIKLVSGYGLVGGDRSLVFKLAHGTGDFLCTPQQLQSLHDQVLKDATLNKLANLPYLRWFIEHQSSMQDLARGRPTESLYLQQPTRCFTPHLFALVDPRGGVYPCCFLFEDNEGYTESVSKKRREHCLGQLTADTRFSDIWNGPNYEQLRDDLSIIDPSSKRFDACGECTRHCNHNVWLSRLFEEYKGLLDADGDADAVMDRVGQRAESRPIWL